MLISWSGDEKEMWSVSRDVGRKWAGQWKGQKVPQRRHTLNADAADRRSKKGTRNYLPIETLLLKRQLLIGSVQVGIRDRIRK